MNEQMELNAEAAKAASHDYILQLSPQAARRRNMKLETIIEAIEQCEELAECELVILAEDDPLAAFLTIQEAILEGTITERDYSDHCRRAGFFFTMIGPSKAAVSFIHSIWGKPLINVSLPNHPARIGPCLRALQNIASTHGLAIIDSITDREI